MREEKPKGTKCPGINGLISEGDEITGNVSDKKVLDAAIIGAAQAVEHYEITRYGSLIAWAREMGRGDFADILQENLDEEVAADEKLSGLAKSRVNKLASGRTSRQGAKKRPAKKSR